MPSRGSDSPTPLVPSDDEDGDASFGTPPRTGSLLSTATSADRRRWTEDDEESDLSFSPHVFPLDSSRRRTLDDDDDDDDDDNHRAPSPFRHSGGGLGDRSGRELSMNAASSSLPSWLFELDDRESEANDGLSGLLRDLEVDPRLGASKVRRPARRRSAPRFIVQLTPGVMREQVAWVMFWALVPPSVRTVDPAVLARDDDFWGSVLVVVLYAMSHYDSGYVRYVCFSAKSSH